MLVSHSHFTADRRLAKQGFGLVRYALMMALVVMTAALGNTGSASAETRTLKMYFTHTKERATITFKKNGKYIPSGLKKANRFLRDWRRKEPTKMDPKLLDIVWEVYQKSGSKKPIHVISGYRSPRTNSMLRRRGRGVARNSQHTRGKALDFFLPDVPVTKLRALGLRAHRGGVGFYRGSFVHLDTGRVRHWPKMSRKALSRIFPRGKTVHIPSNGRPLKGYKIAAANLKRGLNADGSRRGVKSSGSLIASIFKKKEKKKPVAVAKKPTTKPAAKPEKKPAVKVPAPTEVAKAKPAGADPFAAELALAKKAAEEAKTAKPATDTPEKATPEAVAVAVLAPNRVPLPVRRPAAPAVALAALTNNVNAALSPAATATAQQAAGQEVTLAAPSALTTALRPPADISPVAQALSPISPTARPALNSDLRPALRPTPPAAVSKAPKPIELASLRTNNTQLRRAPVESAALAAPQSAPAVKPAVGSPEKIAALNENIRKALARRRVLTDTTVSSQTKINADLANGLARLAVPSPANRDFRRASQGDQQPTTPIQTAALDTDRFGRVTTPKLRQALGDRFGEPKRASQVPVPKASLNRVAPAATDRMQPELRLGNLDSSRVKTWAVAESTRIGPVATLVAPKYAQGTRRAAPASVFSHGFGEPGPRLRADRFTGRALTRVAFAHFASLN